MPLADETPRNVVDELVRDGAEDQKRKGLVPEVQAVRDFVTGIVERMERKPSRSTPNRSTLQRYHPPQRSGAELRQEYEKRARRAGIEPIPGDWVTERKPDTNKKLVDPRKLRSKGARLLSQRLRQLRRDPEWLEKLKTPMAKMQWGETQEIREQGCQKLMDLVEQSNRVFGDWRKPKEKPLFFNV